MRPPGSTRTSRRPRTASIAPQLRASATPPGASGQSPPGAPTAAAGGRRSGALTTGALAAAAAAAAAPGGGGGKGAPSEYAKSEAGDKEEFRVPASRGPGSVHPRSEYGGGGGVGRDGEGSQGKGGGQDGTSSAGGCWVSGGWAVWCQFGLSKAEGHAKAVAAIVPAQPTEGCSPSDHLGWPHHMSTSTGDGHDVFCEPEVVPDLPPSWVPKLSLSRDSYDMRCPKVCWHAVQRPTCLHARQGRGGPPGRSQLPAFCISPATPATPAPDHPRLHAYLHRCCNCCSAPPSRATASRSTDAASWSCLRALAPAAAGMG